MLEDQIIKLLRSEGFIVNEAVKDAVIMLIDTADEETEAAEDQSYDEDDEDVDDPPPL